MLAEIVERTVIDRTAPDPADGLTICSDWVTAMKPNFLIIGGGQAAAKAAEALRSEGFEGGI